MDPALSIALVALMSAGSHDVIWSHDAVQVAARAAPETRYSLGQMSIDIPRDTSKAEIARRTRQLAESVASMGGCAGGSEAARRIGADYVTNEDIRLRHLPPFLHAPLANLAPGQAIAPFGSSERVSVIILCGRFAVPPAPGAAQGRE